MCDTQLLRQNNATFFAKNSDREPSEAQHIVRVAPVENDLQKAVATTYLNIPQTSKRFGLVLSKPHWIWGAEMGVNDQGVCIGNEAVFTRLIEKKGQALLGMDLVRLALERSSCADDALNTICELINRYGQGGPAGHRDKSFRYDNSFIIADPAKAWILETAGKWWAAKEIHQFGAISNSLSIGEDYDQAKKGIEDFARKQGFTNKAQPFNFAKAFDTRLMPFFGAANARKTLSLNCLATLHDSNQASLRSMTNNLRKHRHEKKHVKQQSNHDICMHAASTLRPSQTCGSMVVELNPDLSPQIMMTGTSAPCLSLFRAIDFNFNRQIQSEYIPSLPENQQLWHRFEAIHWHALNHPEFRQHLKASRDSIESLFLREELDSIETVSKQNLIAENWLREWEAQIPNNKRRYGISPYQRFWRSAHQH